MAYCNIDMPPYAPPLTSTSNCNWYDGSSSSSFYHNDAIQQPLQLEPNSYNNSHNGLAYSQPVHMQTHPHVPAELEFPPQMTDSTAFHAPSMPNVKMRNSNLFGATSYDANERSRSTTLAEPLNGYAPCQGPRPWNFAQCYGSYGEPACPLVNIIDIEDFMWVKNS